MRIYNEINGKMRSVGNVKTSDAATVYQYSKKMLVAGRKHEWWIRAVGSGKKNYGPFSQSTFTPQ